MKLSDTNVRGVDLKLHPNIKLDRLHGVDALRGWAAFGVVLLHSFFIHPIDMPQYMEILTSFLALGVPLFFVISAFSMTYAYTKRLNSKNDIINYVLRRFFRIAPLFYVMLFAWTVYLYSLGSPLKSYTEYLFNVLFLYGLIPSMQVSIVPAGWSIGVEWLFYILFPVIVIFILRPFPTFFLFIIALGLSHYTNQAAGEKPDYYYITNFFTNLPYFMFGLLAYKIYAINSSNGVRTLLANKCLIASLLIMALMMYLSWEYIDFEEAKTKPHEIYKIFGWGLAFGLLVLSQALNPNRFICNRFSIFLGAISYSLYLVHPLIIFSSSFIERTNNSSMYFLVKMILSGIISLVLSICVGWLLFKFIENPGIKIGKYATQKIKNNKSK